MSEQSEIGDCFLWTDHDENARETVQGYARSKCQPNSDFVVLGTESAPGDVRSRTLLGFLVETLRRAGSFPNGATTLLTVPEHYLALQLCVARVKQETGPFDATGGEVLFNDSQYQQHLAAPDEYPASEFVQGYVDFLAHSNTANHWQVLAKFKAIVASGGDVGARLARCVFFVHGPVRSKFVRECLAALFEGRRVQLLTAEMPLDVSLNGGCDVSDVGVSSETLLGPVPESSPTRVEGEAATDFMTHVVLAFLRVLVNSRDEVALATAMASPVVRLPHDAFTELKRLSLDSGMPMCQTVVSYVLKARLGAQECALTPFLCKLSEFVDVLHRLQTFAEEEDATTAVRKAVGLLVSRVRRAEGHELAWDRVLELKADLLSLAGSLELLGCEAKKESEGRSGVGTLRVLRSMADALSTRRLSYNPTFVLYNMDSQGTPLNVPRMLDYFKTPESPEEVDEYCEPLSKRISNKLGIELSCPRRDPDDAVPPTKGGSRPLALLNAKTKNARLAADRVASKEHPKKLESKTKRSLMPEINGSAKRKRIPKAASSRQLLPNQKTITSFFVRT